MKTATRKPTAMRRQEIAAAVLRIVGERGVAALTTAVIAEEVGLTTGALFRHFASLDEILIETIRYGLIRVESTLPDPSLPPRQRLMALARARVQLLGPDPGLAWLLQSEQARLRLPPEAALLLVELVRHSREFILKALREGAADGTIRTDIHPEALRVVYVGTVHAAIGMQTAGRLASGELGSGPEQALSALETIIAPPDGGSDSRL